MEAVLILAVSLVAFAAIAFVVGRRIINKRISRRTAERKAKEQTVVLKIKVSKVNEKGPLAAEQMFASIHGMLRNLEFSDRLEGKYQEYISFEITAHKRNIEFFLWLPRRLREFVEGQIYAQYTDVEIIEVPDYTREVVLDDAVGTVVPTAAIPARGGTGPQPVATSTEQGLVPVKSGALSTTSAPRSSSKQADLLHVKTIAATEIILAKDTVLPIKLYGEFGTIDPLSGITATLGKLDAENEDVWLQIIVRPVPDSWQEKGVKEAEAMRAGKTVEKPKPLPLRILVAVVTAPFRMLKFLASSGGEEKKSDAPKKEMTEAQKNAVEGTMRKAAKLGYQVRIRAMYLSGNELPGDTAQSRLQSIVGSFKQFNTTMLNGFAARTLDAKAALDAYRKRDIDWVPKKHKAKSTFILNIEELATIYHLPNVSVRTPNIVWVTSKKAEPPVDLPTTENTDIADLTLIGNTNFRGFQKTFGIKTKDRMRHTYVIGKTGMGKSVLLENMIISDILAGKGVTLVDPHGETADHVLEAIPAWRQDDVILFDPSDTAYPVAINLLENNNPEYRPLVASGIVGIFYKLYANSWGPRLEHVLRNTLLALLETPGTTMLGIMRMLADAGYRDMIVGNVTDPMVRSFWLDEFANYKPQNMSEIVGPIQNKVGQFLSSHVIRNVLGQPVSTFSIRQAMDEKKIFIANLSKGKIGDDASALLGSMLITKLQIDAMSRSNIAEEDRVEHNLFVDEFQNFATDAFAVILSEARKYKLSLTMANQYVNQMEDVVKNAVFGNVGTLICFQLGYDDATYFSSQFGRQLLDTDIMSLDKYTVYIRLLIDNQPAPAFSATTLPPVNLEKDPERVKRIIQSSREKYGHPRAEVEAQIRAWSEEGKKPGADKGIKIDVDTLKIGQELEGVINNVADLGLFVNYFNLSGLIHNNEMPDKSLKERVKKGDIIKSWLSGLKGDKLSLTLNEGKAKLLQKQSGINPDGTPIGSVPAAASGEQKTENGEPGASGADVKPTPADAPAAAPAVATPSQPKPAPRPIPPVQPLPKAPPRPAQGQPVRPTTPAGQRPAPIPQPAPRPLPNAPRRPAPQQGRPLPAAKRPLPTPLRPQPRTEAPSTPVPAPAAPAPTAEAPRTKNILDLKDLV